MALTPDAQRVYDAFWSAADALAEDPTVHGMEQPYFDKDMGMVDGSGTGIPGQFWEHFAAALNLPRKVWVVLATEDDDTSHGYRYLSGVFSTPEKAQEYADKGWAMDVDEAEVE